MPGLRSSGQSAGKLLQDSTAARAPQAAAESRSDWDLTSAAPEVSHGLDGSQSAVIMLNPDLLQTLVPQGPDVPGADRQRQPGRQPGGGAQPGDRTAGDLPPRHHPGPRLWLQPGAAAAKGSNLYSLHRFGAACICPPCSKLCTRRSVCTSAGTAVLLRSTGRLRFQRHRRTA
jgi:hypothetical protein